MRAARPQRVPAGAGAPCRQREERGARRGAGRRVGRLKEGGKEERREGGSWGGGDSRRGLPKSRGGAGRLAPRLVPAPPAISATRSANPRPAAATSRLGGANGRAGPGVCATCTTWAGGRAGRAAAPNRKARSHCALPRGAAGVGAAASHPQEREKKNNNNRRGEGDGNGCLSVSPASSP